jgi:hypothetical protein
MSLVLSKATPKDTTVFTTFTGQVVIGDIEIPLDEFCTLAMYVLTNTDLAVKDPRLAFIRNVMSLKERKGYNFSRNKKSKRLAINW